MAHLEVYSITVLEIEWNFALAGGDGHILWRLVLWKWRTPLWAFKCQGLEKYSYARGQHIRSNCTSQQRKPGSNRRSDSAVFKQEKAEKKEKDSAKQKPKPWSSVIRKSRCSDSVSKRPCQIAFTRWCFFAASRCQVCAYYVCAFIYVCKGVCACHAAKLQCVIWLLLSRTAATSEKQSSPFPTFLKNQVLWA